MNSIDKNIFASYETVETALLNDLATETRTKGKKARTLKGEGYYVKYDGVQYDITPEQCRIYKLIRNNYDMFVKQLNSAKSDILGVWKIGFGDRLPVIIAEIERGLEICQKYFDAFKSYITEDEATSEENEDEVVSETSEKNDEPVAVEMNDETKNVVETETNNEEHATPEVETNFGHGSYKDAQNQEHSTAPHVDTSCTTTNTA